MAVETAGVVLNRVYSAPNTKYIGGCLQVIDSSYQDEGLLEHDRRPGVKRDVYSKLYGEI